MVFSPSLSRLPSFSVCGLMNERTHAWIRGINAREGGDSLRTTRVLRVWMNRGGVFKWRDLVLVRVWAGDFESEFVVGGSDSSLAAARTATSRCAWARAGLALWHRPCAARGHVPLLCSAGSWTALGGASAAQGLFLAPKDVCSRQQAGGNEISLLD